MKWIHLIIIHKCVLITEDKTEKNRSRGVSLSGLWQECELPSVFSGLRFGVFNRPFGSHFQLTKFNFELNHIYLLMLRWRFNRQIFTFNNTHTLTVHTGASGGLGGGQGDSPQAEQFEEGGGLLVELTQLSLCPRQVYAAETQQKVTGEKYETGL